MKRSKKELRKAFEEPNIKTVIRKKQAKVVGAPLQNENLPANICCREVMGKKLQGTSQVNLVGDDPAEGLGRIGNTRLGLAVDRVVWRRTI